MDTILLTGKTRLFPADALSYISGAYNVFAADKNRNDKNRDLPENVRIFSESLSDGDFNKLFEAGEIRAVWHITSCVDGGKSVDEKNQIETLLSCCARYGVGRLIVVTENSDPTDHGSIIRKWSQAADGRPRVDVAAVMLPLMSGTDCPGSLLGRIFCALRERKTVFLDGEAGTQLGVLSVGELASLLARMTSETWFRPGIYSAVETVTSLENFRQVLLSCRPGAQIEYGSRDRALRAGGQRERKNAVSVRLPMPEKAGFDGQLGKMYRLPAASDWEEDISRQYAGGLSKDSGPLPLRERAVSWIGRFGKFAGTVLDLAVMFVIAEFLAKFTSASVYFKIVDVRLLYVVLMGMMHGLAAGSAAAILQCIMLVIRYGEIGISGLLLFYNVENWIPFVYYLTAGVIAGYTHQKNEQKMRFVSGENELIRNKYLFLNEAYRTSVRDKKELRAQVLSEKESYRKLFEGVRRMSQRTPEAVCVEAVQVLRKLLDNGTVCIYQEDPAARRARLLSCSRENSVRQEIDLSQLPDMMDAVTSGRVWKNTGFIEAAPMYAAQVSFDRKHPGSDGVPYALLVTVEQVSQEQMSLWYVNHFEILCALFQDALESAALRERVLE